MQLFDFDFCQNSDLLINIIIYNLDINRNWGRLGSNTDDNKKIWKCNLYTDLLSDLGQIVGWQDNGFIMQVNNDIQINITLNNNFKKIFFLKMWKLLMP